MRIVALAIGLSFCAFCHAETYFAHVGVAHGNAKPMIEECAKSYNAAHAGSDPVSIEGTNPHDGMAGLAQGKFDLLVKEGREFTDRERLWLIWKHGDAAASVETLVIGQIRVVVLANPGYQDTYLSRAKMHQLLANSAASAKMFEQYHIYGIGQDSWQMRAVRDWVLVVGGSRETGFCWDLFRKDYRGCRDDLQVVEKVHTDRDGIGFIVWSCKQPPGVKVLAVGNDEKTAVAPSSGPILRYDYPLTETIVVCTRHGAPYAAKKFVSFLAGEDGSKIMEKYGVLSAWTGWKHDGDLRVKDLKAGRGAQVAIVGLPRGRAAFEALGFEYVKARAVVRVEYTPADTDLAGMGQFLDAAGKQGFLVLDDRPSERALAALGTKWSALNPTEFVIAGRAAAVVVNPANKLAALTLDQVRAVFGGEVIDWSMLGSGADKGAAGAINLYGLPATDPAGQVFLKEGLAAEKWGGIKVKKDSAEVLAAVAADSQAIGFVDLTAIPPSDKSVKVLMLQQGTGERARFVRPSADTIKNALYPLSQRVYLYVHPQASDAAKDFAKFVATCGPAEVTPYADTVKAMMDAYRKSGLVPLGDSAIERAAKDAFLPTMKSGT